MESTAAFIVGCLLLVGFVLVMRLLGAWMLRINEVITSLNTIKEILRVKLTEEEKEEVRKRLG